MHQHERYKYIAIRLQERMKGRTMKKIQLAVLAGISILILLYFSSPSTNHQKNSSIHLVVERYNGLPSHGITDLALFQCWANSINLSIRIVEPHIRENTIVTTLKQSLEDSEDILMLGDYYNLQRIKSSSNYFGMPGIISFYQTLSSPLQNLIFVKMNSKDTEVLWTSSPEIPCYNESKHDMVRFTTMGYCVLRIVAVQWTNLINKNIGFILGPYFKKNITLVLSAWEPLQSIEEKRPLHSCYIFAKHWLHPSKKLLRYVKHYKDKYLAYNDALAILIDFEHLLMRNKRYNKNSSSVCFEKVTKAIELHNLLHPVITDMDEQNENSYWSVKEKLNFLDAKRQFKEASSIWLNKPFNYQEWEESFGRSANFYNNPNYIAELQRTIAARADCLVLVGGGDNQELVLRRYLHQHEDQKKWCLHFICIHNGYTLNQIVKLIREGFY